MHHARLGVRTASSAGTPGCRRLAMSWSRWAGVQVSGRYPLGVFSSGRRASLRVRAVEPSGKLPITSERRSHDRPAGRPGASHTKPAREIRALAVGCFWRASPARTLSPKGAPPHEPPHHPAEGAIACSARPHRDPRARRARRLDGGRVEPDHRRRRQGPVADRPRYRQRHQSAHCEHQETRASSRRTSRTATSPPTTSRTAPWRRPTCPPTCAVSSAAAGSNGGRRPGRQRRSTRAPLERPAPKGDTGDTGPVGAPGAFLVKDADDTTAGVLLDMERNSPWLTFFHKGHAFVALSTSVRSRCRR